MNARVSTTAAADGLAPSASKLRDHKQRRVIRSGMWRSEDRGGRKTAVFPIVLSLRRNARITDAAATRIATAGSPAPNRCGAPSRTAQV